MTNEQIEQIKRMISSDNKDDVILGVQMIYQNKPFHSYKTLIQNAKSRISIYAETPAMRIYDPYWTRMSNQEFFNKILNMQKGKTLYKKDSTGKIRYIKIWTDGADLVSESGVLDTDNPKEDRKTCKEKNIGKSNATIGEQQAKLEMKSKIAEKLKEDYFEKLEDAKNGQVILPMLAKTYKDHKHKIDWSTAFVQPKLDGMRALAVCKNGKVELISRVGGKIETVPHIIEALESFNLKDVILDGELYCHGIGFQNNMKLIKKYRPGETEKIQYWMYDVVSEDKFMTRRRTLELLIHPSLVNVETNLLRGEEYISKFHRANLNNTYEGSIIRWGNVGYKINGRSENLLKYKDFQDIALPIIDITENDANPKHGTPWFELKGKKFKTGVKLSHEEREDLLTNKNNYLNKTAEVRYFELSEEGIPRFGVMVGIRLDK